MAAAKNPLFNVAIKDLVVEKRPLVAVPSHCSLQEALNILRKERLISVPIYGMPNHWIGSGFNQVTVNDKEYIGIVNLGDILKLCLKSRDVQEQMKLPIYLALGQTNESQSLWAEPTTQRLSLVLELFSKGVHHILVYDEEDVKNPIKILSQSDVVRYFYQNSSNFPLLQTVFASPVSTVATGDVDCISTDSLLIDALQTVAKHFAAPLVNPNNDVIGSLALPNLRDFYDQFLEDSGDTTSVEKYFERYFNNIIPQPYFCNPEESIAAAVELIVAHKIRRLWIKKASATGIIIKMS
jgi:CBS domain-containing protein